MSKVFKSMKYNGISLDPYIVIKKITRPPTAEITNETKHIALRGLSLTRRRFGGKVIKVDAFIKSNVLATIDKLNSIFSEQEKRLNLMTSQIDIILCLFNLLESLQVQSEMLT